MTFKNFVCKGILVFAGLLLLGWIGKYIYMVDGEIDWFRFMLVYGVPVGIPHMFIIIPWHWDLSGILGMVALLFFVWLWYIGLGIVKAALKSSIFLFFLEQLCYFNLSPQGDGNILLIDLFLITALFQLIPARGRKPTSVNALPYVVVISTYPRKGTETGRRQNR